MSGAADTLATTRLTRDGVTLTGYLFLATWGWFLYGFGALLPQLGRDQGISATVTSLHSVALAIGSVIAGVILVPLIRRFRRRGVLWIAGVAVLIGCVLVAAGGAWTPVTLAAVLFTGVGGSLVVSSANPLLDDHHGEQGASALAEGNALAASFGLVAPLVVGASIAAGLTWRPAMLLTIPLAVAACLVAVRQPKGAPALDRDIGAAGGPRTPLPAAFWPVAGMLMACVGVEFCLSAWSAELLRTRTGLSAGAAAAGVSAVIGGMTVGRLVTGRLALRRPARPLMLFSILLCLAGWAVAWSFTSPAAALTGLFVAGLGMAAHYPLGASMAMRAAAGLRDQASGVISIGVGVAAGAGPFAIGALSDATSTHTAFLVVPVLLVTALVLFAVSAERRSVA